MLNMGLLATDEDRMHQVTEVSVVISQESPVLMKKGTLQGSTIMEDGNASSKQS